MLDSNHFDITTLCGLRGSGAIVLGFFLVVPLLMQRGMFHTKAVLRYKLIFYVLEFLYFAYYGWWVNDPMLVQSFFQGFAFLKASLAVWLFQASRHKSVPEAPQSTQPQNAKLLFYGSTAYILPWALFFVLAPMEFSPAGRLPFFADELEDSEPRGFDALQECAFALEGVHMIGCLAWMYDCIKHNTHIDVKFVIPPALYLWPMVSVLLHSEDVGFTADRPKYLAVMFAHVSYLAFFLRAIIPEKDKSPTVASAIPTQSPESK